MRSNAFCFGEVASGKCFGEVAAGRSTTEATHGVHTRSNAFAGMKFDPIASAMK